MSIQPGKSILNGKYRILRLIGEGGMARVWLAEEPRFGNRRVAIKEPRANLPPELRREVALRYHQEVQVCAALEQAGVRNVVQAITTELHDDDLLLILKYMPGGHLGTLVEENPGGLPIDRAIEITGDILTALDGVHGLALEVVHRDIKPANILFDDRGTAYLADFGLAQLAGMSGRSQLAGGQHPGTPMYMAPEQESSPRSLTPAADLYALGCVLFEMLTGKRYKRVRPGTLPSSLRNEVPPWLDDVVAHALVEDPWERYADAGEMAATMRRAEERDRAQAAEEERRREAEERAQAQAAKEAQRREAEERAKAQAAEEARRRRAEESKQARRPATERQGAASQASRRAERSAWFWPTVVGAASVLLIAITVALWLLLLGGGGGAENQATKPTEGVILRVAVIMPSTINDLAWSQSMYDALLRVQADMGGPEKMELVYRENMFVIDDAAVAIRDYAAQGFDLIIAHGSQYGSSVKAIAPDFPTTAFAYGPRVDTFVNEGISNVFAYEAASHEGGYVNGVMAGKLTKSNVIGVVGPIETGDAALYIDGFEADVKASNPDAQVNVSYIGSFTDVALASKAAITHISAGADILSGTAQMVVGAIDKAKDNGVLWFGTEVSKTSLAPDIVVANQIYDWTVVLNDIIEQMDKGIFGGKAYVITLENRGQFIEYNPDFNLPDDVKQLAEDTIAGIKDGSITIPIGE